MILVLFYLLALALALKSSSIYEFSLVLYAYVAQFMEKNSFC